MSNAHDLRALLLQHGITQARAAELIGYSVKAVESWLAKPGSAFYRPMPDRAMKALRLALKG